MKIFLLVTSVAVVGAMVWDQYRINGMDGWKWAIAAAFLYMQSVVIFTT